MARLVSYKMYDENQYSTFGAEFNSISSMENDSTTSSLFQLVQKRRRKRSRSRKLPWRQCILCQCLCCIKIRGKLCPCCRNRRWCRFCGSDDDDAEENDIDRQFNRYKYEMSTKKTPKKVEPGVNSEDKSPSQKSTLRADEVKRAKKHFWNWNDSLKSNSDKFLESLEYDAMQGNSLKKYTRIPKIRIGYGERRN